MLSPLFADPLPFEPWVVVLALVGIAVFLVFLFICFNFVQLWIQAYLTGARDRLPRHGPHEAAARSITP